VPHLGEKPPVLSPVISLPNLSWVVSTCKHRSHIRYSGNNGATRQVPNG